MTGIDLGRDFYQQISIWRKIEFHLRYVVEHLLGETCLNRQIKKWEARNLAVIHQQVMTATSHRVSVPTYSSQLPTGPDFIRHYVRQGHPVVLKGAASNWKAVKNWDFQFLRNRYGDQPVFLTNHKELGDAVSGPPEQTDLRSIIDGLSVGSSKYARFNPLLDNHPELLDDLNRAWFSAVMGLGLWKHNVLFVGNKATKTNIHNAGSENIFVQIRGTKRWLLWDQQASYVINPEVNRAPAKASSINPNDPSFSAFQKLPVYEVVLEPGDILYIPSYLWHYVENLTPTIGVGLRWISPLDALRNSPLFALLEPVNTAPSIFTTLNFRKHGFNFNKILYANLRKRMKQ